MGKLAYTWDLLGASWNVLKRDKALVVFPLLSGVCCLIVTASFIIPIALGDHWRMPNAEATPAQRIIYWGTLFCFYFANYFVITFFNVGIVSCAVSRMAGGEPTVGGGMREAMSRIHLIAAWALVAATVGLVLRILEERSGKFGKIITAILGSAWSIMTFLVVPVLVVENKGPVEAFKTSASLLKKTWGEQLAGNFSFGLAFFLFNIPGIIGIVAGAVLLSKSMVLGIIILGLSVLYLIASALVHSALASIFQAAVYMYTQGVVDQAQGFPVQLLQGAMVVK